MCNIYTCTGAAGDTHFEHFAVTNFPIKLQISSDGLLWAVFQSVVEKKTGTERCLKIIKLSATNRADLICCCVLTFFLSQGQKGEPGDITDVSWCHTHNMQHICVVIWKSLFVNYVRTVNPEVTEISFKLTRHTQNSPRACSGEVFRYFTGNWTTSKTSSKDNTSHTQAEGQKSPLFYPLLV